MAALYQEFNQSNINNQESARHKNHEMPIYLPPLEKQRIGYILDSSSDEHTTKLPSLIINKDSNNNYQFIPYEPTSENIQTLPSPASSSVSDDDLEREELHNQARRITSQQPTENEIQYIKRIHALMTLVARQTDEIQSLRAIIASHNKESVEYDDHTASTGNKRNRTQ